MRSVEMSGSGERIDRGVLAVTRNSLFMNRLCWSFFSRINVLRSAHFGTMTSSHWGLRIVPEEHTSTVCKTAEALKSSNI